MVASYDDDPSLKIYLSLLLSSLLTVQLWMMFGIVADASLYTRPDAERVWIEGQGDVVSPK